MNLIYRIFTFITLVVVLFVLTIAVYMTAFYFCIGHYLAQKIKTIKGRLGARERLSEENNPST